ncbi:MAG: glycosyltransferase [Coriobacteriales bacterium]|nr:glycosyltransferase [Coriobacteriales bacterium]
MAVLGALGVLSMFTGVPTALSIGGGLIVLCFGSLWPILWIASLLPAKHLPFLKAQHSPTDAGGAKPYITILAPARNEEPVAERLVRQFLEQDYENWQLIVIANNCTDRTADVAREAAHGDPRVVVVEATFDNGVKADALNLALEKHTSGDVVLELDSDNQVPSDLLHKLAMAFSDPNVDACQTQIRAYNTKGSLLATFQDLEFLIYSEVWNRGRAALGLSSSIGGTGFAARTHILRQMKGWTRDLVEDFEMHTRLVRAGVNVTYLPWAWVYDEKPVSWDAIIKQRKRWIRGHLEVAARITKGGEKMGIVDRFYLYSPAIIGLMLALFAMGYLSVLFPKLIPGYAYFSPWFWFASIVIMVTALATTAWRAGSPRLVPLVIPYLLFFTFHWIVVLLSAAAPVSWAHSKTVHGVSAERGVGPWLGVDGPPSLRLMGAIAAIAFVWQFPLWIGLPDAPSIVEAPVLSAKRTSVAWVQDTALAAGVVEGHLEKNGKPLKNAWIEIVASDGQVYRTRTDHDGNFVFASIPPGPTTITIDKGGVHIEMDFDQPPEGGVTVSGDVSGGGGGGVVIVPIPY